MWIGMGRRKGRAAELWERKRGSRHCREPRFLVIADVLTEFSELDLVGSHSTVVVHAAALGLFRR